MKTTRRFRWKPLGVLTAVLVVVVVATCLFVGKAQEQKEFVSQMDPESGYRCRFTVSSDWHKDSNSASGVPGSAFLYMDSFSPAPPNPIMSWISTHLFHQTETAMLPPNISLICPRPHATRSIFQVQAGYPELVHRNQVNSNRITTHRHLRIDGFPAIVTTVADKSYNGTMLIVYVPDHSVSYVVNGGTDTQNAAPVNLEMQAIISSFHVEKVPAPTGTLPEVGTLVRGSDQPPSQQRAELLRVAQYGSEPPAEELLRPTQDSGQDV